MEVVKQKTRVSGTVTFENEGEVRFDIENGELISLDIFAPKGEDFKALDQSDLVKNLRKGIPPHG